MDDDRTFDSFDDEQDPSFDARARAAGRALRDPAPADGLGRVQSARRRRTMLQTGTAVVVTAMVLGGVIAVLRSGNETPDSVATPVATPATFDPASPNPTSTTVEGGEPDPASSPASSAGTGETTTPPNTPASTPPADTAPAPTEVTVPYVPAGTSAVPEWGDRTTPLTEPLADGLYWSNFYSSSSDGTAITFRLAQRIRGQACVEEFSEGADEACASGGALNTEPAAFVTLTVGDTADTSVVAFDGGNSILAYRVPVAEFIALASGEAPSPGAPDGYTWYPWGAGIVLRNGQIVAAHQEFSS